jgi:hypothetical protein
MNAPCGEEDRRVPDNLREWRGHHVFDAEGHKIVIWKPSRSSPGTGVPSLATVKLGMPARHRLVFVPVDDAPAGPGYLKVSYDKE